MVAASRPQPGGVTSTGPRPRLVIIGSVLTACMVIFAIAALMKPWNVRAAGSTAVHQPAAAGRLASAATTSPEQSAPGVPDQPSVAADGTRAAVNSYRNGNVAGAIAELTAVVDANPTSADALNDLGQALVRAKRPSDAISYFDRAIARSPETWAYHFNRARASAELLDWPGAIAGYRRAAALFPEDYATQFNLARALQANGDLADAVDAFQRAVVLAPGQPDFLLSLGTAQEAARRPAEAAASYRKYLELQPASPDAEKIKDRIARLTS